METETLAMAQEIDFSVLALFMKATLTNKLVLMSLLAMSFWSWSIIVQRILTFRRAREEAAVFDRAFWSGEPLDELFEKIGPTLVGTALLLVVLDRELQPISMQRMHFTCLPQQMAWIEALLAQG